MFISGIEESNPEALMEAARQEFRDKMAQYNMALAKMAGIAERLKVQIKSKSVRAQDLERRVLANHRAGNMDLAGSLARELQEFVKARLAPYKYPRAVEFAPSLPKNDRGKIERRRLK